MKKLIALALAGFLYFSIAAGASSNMVVYEDNTEKFTVNGKEHTITLRYVDGGAAITLDDKKTTLGEELETNDNFKANGIKVEAEDVGYSDNKGYLKFTAEQTQMPETVEYNGVSISTTDSAITVQTSITLRDGCETASSEVNRDGDYIKFRFYSETPSDIEETRKCTQVVTQEEEIASEEVSPGTYHLEIEKEATRNEKINFQKTVEVGADEKEENSDTNDDTGDKKVLRVSDNDDTEKFTVNGKEHTITLRYVDGGAAITLDDQKSGTLRNGDTFTANDVAITVEETGYQSQIGYLRFTAEQTTPEAHGQPYREKKGQSENNENTEENSQPDTGQNVIEIESNTVEVGETVSGVAKVKEMHSGSFKLLVKDNSGETVYSNQGTGTEKEFDFQPEEPGVYTIQVKPTNIVSRLKGLISDTSITETRLNVEKEVDKTENKDQAYWKTYCSSKGQAASINSQISCIQNDIVENCFAENVGRECTRVGNSICEDLLGYGFDKTEGVCSPENEG